MLCSQVDPALRSLKISPRQRDRLAPRSGASHAQTLLEALERSRARCRLRER